MHNTGAIISGSSALQIFARVHYDESDLDLYVEETKAYSVSLCLSGLGYSRLESNIATKDSLDPGDSYPGKTEIERVETFRHHESERIVQLINTVREPIFAVLQFHSSTSETVVPMIFNDISTACVMNIVMHTRAYSLYPFSALCAKSTLVCGPTTNKIVGSLQKYE